MGYKLVNRKITEDGHTLFMEDVLNRLKRLDFLEKHKKALIKVIDKHFWNCNHGTYECEIGFLTDLDKIGKGEFAILGADER